MRKIADEILTLPKLQKFIHVGFYTAKNLLETGKIPGRRFGKEWRVSKEAVIRWMNEGDARQADGDQ
jgi:excisionase family DNA binding protein